MTLVKLASQHSKLACAIVAGLYQVRGQASSLGQHHVFSRRS